MTLLDFIAGFVICLTIFIFILMIVAHHVERKFLGDVDFKKEEEGQNDEKRKK